MSVKKMSIAEMTVLLPEYLDMFFFEFLWMSVARRF